MRPSLNSSTIRSFNFLPCCHRSPISSSFVRFYERPAKSPPPLKPLDYFTKAKLAAKEEIAARYKKCKENNRPLAVSHEEFINKHFTHAQNIEQNKDLNPSTPATTAAAASSNSPIFAIFSDRGCQFKAISNDLIMVDKMDQPVGTKLIFDQVLLLGSEYNTMIGRPFISGSRVDAVIEEHAQTPKILVFHKKRRKHHQKIHGHRTEVTVIRINKIVAPINFKQQMTESGEKIKEIQKTQITEQLKASTPPLVTPTSSDSSTTTESTISAQ